MADGNTHRWTSDRPLIRHDTDERIENGDPFAATGHELRAFGDRIAELETTENGGGGGDGNEGSDDAPSDQLTDLGGVGDARAEKLREAGYETIADVRTAEAATLAEDVDGISEDTAADLIASGE